MTDKEYIFDVGDGKTTLKVKPVDIKNHTSLNNYVWVNNKVYIKCPKCGKVAFVDTGVILASMPPQYGWHCKYCNNGGSMFTGELYNAPYEQVTPSQEDKDLYEPPITFSQESISINGDGEVLSHDESTVTWSPNESTEGVIYLDPHNNSHLKVYSHCEICGALMERSAISTGTGDVIPHICPDCAEKLRKLIGK